MKKPEIENLKAQMAGWVLNSYQKGLALDEYYKLIDWVNHLESNQKEITDTLIETYAYLDGIGGFVRSEIETILKKQGVDI